MPRRTRSGFRGVAWHSHAGKWYARVKFLQREISLGYYNSAEEAAKVYDIAARLLFGAEAVTNYGGNLPQTVSVDDVVDILMSRGIPASYLHLAVA